MPHCCVVECHNQAKKSPKDSKLRFHKFPNDKMLRKAWINAVGRTSLPTDPRVCSDHFERSCFEESYLLELELMGSSRTLKSLKPDAVPTLFPHKPKRKARLSSIKLAEKRQRLEMLDNLLHEDQGSIHSQEEDVSEEEQEPDLAIKMCDEATQTEAWPCVMVDKSTQCDWDTTEMCDAQCQFPRDVIESILVDHNYFSPVLPNLIRDDEEETNEDSQVDLFPELSGEESSEDESVIESNYGPMDSSQSECVASEGESYSVSQEETEPSSQESEKMENDKNRVFLVYEEKLKELLRFCPKCGSLVVPESIEEIKNEGSQLTLKLNCMSNCFYKWQSQPSLGDIKGTGNLSLTAGIFFSGIPFAKFESFARLTNLKAIGKGTYFNLREQFLFPVVKSTWEDEQKTVLNELKTRESGVVLAGDGRCDSPGHSAKYCTYTFLDVESKKVVDFNVVAVTEVANSNQMEKKGFLKSLNNIEADGIKVDIISTDWHAQIKKEMRVNHSHIDHQFDPWHLAKSVSKKLLKASKKSGRSDLAVWIPSVVNHLWWSAQTCNEDPGLLCEKWLSVIHHVTDRHEWPGNKHFHKCEHAALTDEERKKKIWLKPGSAAHTALVKTIKDKTLLKDLAHMTQCVHTTSLEVYHSMYLKYLPKLVHFSHDVMKIGTMLAALDHNFNVNRPQALIQTGECEGEPRFKISWSKVTKRFGAEPVLEKKSYKYLEDMIATAFDLAALGNKQSVQAKGRTGVMAPAERPNRKEIISTRQRLSRFN